MKEIPNLQEILAKTVITILDQTIAFFTNLVVAIVILIIGFVIAKIVFTIIKNVLAKVGFDKIGETFSNISIIKDSKIEIKLSSVISKGLYYYILLIFITVAVQILGVASLSSVFTSLVDFVPQMVVAIVVLMLGIVVSDALKKMVISICQSFNIPSGRLLGNIVFFFLLVIFVINTLGQVGINTTLLQSSFNIIVGGIILAFGAGYGLASRDLMANILSSFYTKNRYREGQIIKIDDVKGTIVKMDNTSITLKTADSTVIIPLQNLQFKNVELFD